MESQDSFGQENQINQYQEVIQTQEKKILTQEQKIITPLEQTQNIISSTTYQPPPPLLDPIEQVKSPQNLNLPKEAPTKQQNLQSSYTLNDLLFPGGKISKLCRLPTPRIKDSIINQILTRLGISEPQPVILLSGVQGDSKSRLLAGVARAAYSTDAIIIDKGLKTGIEVACSRKKVKLVGVCPQQLIQYPSRLSKQEKKSQLATGHSHFFVLGSPGDKLTWDSVVPFKFQLIQKIRRGKFYTCRAICVLVGDSPKDFWEVEKSLKHNWPLIVFQNTPIGQQISSHLQGNSSGLPQQLKTALKEGKVYLFPEQGTAEELASTIQFHLSVSV